MEEIDELVDLKASIHKANVEVYDKIDNKLNDRFYLINPVLLKVKNINKFYQQK